MPPEFTLIGLFCAGWGLTANLLMGIGASPVLAAIIGFVLTTSALVLDKS